MDQTNYITTTELRTKSSELVKILKNGGKVSLIHRSKVVGEIEPKISEAPPITDVKKFTSLLTNIKPKKLIPKRDRKKIYRKKLKKRYGKDIS